MRLTTASRATLMLWTVPRMWILVSARTIRVREAFSIVCRVRPAWPAIRPGKHKTGVGERKRQCQSWEGRGQGKGLTDGS